MDYWTEKYTRVGCEHACGTTVAKASVVLPLTCFGHWGRHGRGTQCVYVRGSVGIQQRHLTLHLVNGCLNTWVPASLTHAFPWVSVCAVN